MLKGDKNRIILHGALIGAIIIAAIVGAQYTNMLNPQNKDFSISIEPVQGLILPGGTIQPKISVTNLHGYTHSVSLSSSGQPNGVVVSVPPPFSGAKPSYVTLFNVNVGSDVTPGSYELTITGTGADGKTHNTYFNLIVIPQNVSTTIPTQVLPTEFVVTDTYYASGWMGDWGDVIVDDHWSVNQHSGESCIKIFYSAERSQGKGWAGLYWQYPKNNWGDLPGQDLSKYSKLTFWAKGETGGEISEFKVGGITGKYPDTIQPAISTGNIKLSNEWNKYTIDLKNQDLSNIIGGFVWVTNADSNPEGCVIYLDDIKYEMG